MASNDKFVQYKKSCAITARKWKHTIHHFRSSLLAGIKDFFTTYMGPSRTQNHPPTAIGHDRSSSCQTRSDTSEHHDPVQEMIDLIVGNRLPTAWSASSLTKYAKEALFAILPRTYYQISNSTSQRCVKYPLWMSQLILKLLLRPQLPRESTLHSAKMLVDAVYILSTSRLRI